MFILKYRSYGTITNGQKISLIHASQGFAIEVGHLSNNQTMQW